MESYFKILTAGIIMASSVSPMVAQILNGKVVDEMGKPVPFANVVLLAMPDSSYVSGCISEQNGSFSLDLKGTHSSILKTSCIGYSTGLFTLPLKEPVVLEMRQNAQALAGITVKGNLPQIRQKGNSLIVNIDGTALSKLGNANDVLEHIPGVIKRNDELEVIGKDAPLIYINGRKLRNKNELKRLSAENIKQVELITNPGAEYDASVSAILKITTLKKMDEGLGVEYTQMYWRTHKNNHVEQLDLNYQHKGLTLFGTFQYNSLQFWQENRNHNLVENAEPLTIESSGIINTSYRAVEGYVGFNEDINENHSFGATYTLDVPTYYEGGWNMLLNVSRNDIPISALDNTLSSMYKKSPAHSADAYYQGKLGKVTLKWNGSLYLTKGGNDNRSEEIDNLQNTHRTVSSFYDNTSKLYATNVSADFPLAKGTLQIGSEYTNTLRKNTYLINGEGTDLPQNTDDKVNEQNVAGFASYNVSFGKVSLEGGLRFEHVKFDYYNKGVFMPGQSRNYNTLFPSFSLSFPVKNVNFALSYTAKARRPSYTMLSGDVQYNDLYDYQTGNTLLQPATIHDVSADISYKWVQFGADYQYWDNLFYQYVKPYEKNEDITVFTYRNLPHYNRLKFSLVLSPKIGIWEPQLSAAVIKPYFHVKEENFERDYDRPIGLFSFNNSLSLPAGFILRLDMSYTTKGNDSAILFEKTGYVNVSLYKSFFHDRLSINLQGNDLFATTRNSNRMIYGKRNFYKWNYPDSRQFMVTLKYRFNTLKDNYKGTGAGNDEKGRL